MVERDTIEAVPRPATVESLTAELTRLGVPAGGTLLVHSSLRSLGWVCGGAVAVIQALQAALGPDGTLMMPSHSTDISDPALWRHPPVPEDWWPVIRESMPPFDARVTPTRQMGAIPECFRSWPGAVRSAHPASSFAAAGPAAGELTAGHPLEDSLGEASPIGRLVGRAGFVLLLGVGHSSNTALHLSERRAFGARQGTMKTGAPRLEAGRRRWVAFEEPLWQSEDFDRLGADLEASSGIVTIGAVGAARARLMPARELVDFGTAWLCSHRNLDGSLREA